MLSDKHVHDITQGSDEGLRKRDRPRNNWLSNITEWTWNDMVEVGHTDRCKRVMKQKKRQKYVSNGRSRKTTLMCDIHKNHANRIITGSLFRRKEA